MKKGTFHKKEHDFKGRSFKIHITGLKSVSFLSKQIKKDLIYVILVGKQQCCLQHNFDYVVFFCPKCAKAQVPESDDNVRQKFP